MDAIIYWIGFSLVKGIGAVRLQALLDYFGSLEVAWQAPADALRAAGLSQKIVETMTQVRHSVDLPRYLESIQKKGIHILTWEDERYPRRLKEIDQPPPVLYVRGTLGQDDDVAVAIVGTRRASVYGRQVAEELAAYLARNGVTVVSGLARGVDTYAHQAAVKNGGRTLAVLGCGVDIIYPPENRKLGEEVIAHGALVSDYAPGTPPEASNFPPRNRIISGLSRASVVVEAGETSGALITASFAANQGREVFAVPGNIYSPLCKGTNRLIQQGATPLLKMEDVLQMLGMEYAAEQVSARRVLPGDEFERKLLDALGSDPLHIDELMERTGLTIDKVSATLALMELKGMVRQVGGMNYVGVRETPAPYSQEGN